MRETLLSLLKCGKCGNNVFSLESAESDSIEVKRGRILCGRCKSSNDIKDGIVDFLERADTSAMRERKAMDEDNYILDENGSRHRITDETIERFKRSFLSMPEGDGSYLFKPGGSFQSIAENSSRVYFSLNDLQLNGKETVLEIGACFSYISFKFAQKGCNVVAIDISNYMKAARLFIKEAYFERIFCDMHSTPFIDSTFDIIFGSAVLHHSKDLGRAFREMYRILKPSGKLVLINESARGVFEKVHPVFKEMQEKGFGDTSYTIPQWKDSAVGAGFKRVRIDFLSLADDYCTRHALRGSGANAKIKVAQFFRRHRKIEKALSFLLIWPRIFSRPKSWRLLAYK